MNSNKAQWATTLDQLIHENRMLSHPFYQKWMEGTLEKKTLQKYAKQYYGFVRAFPTFISQVHSQCDDLEVRRILLSNLIDEENGSPNHIDLWREFAFALEISDEQLQQEAPQEATRQLIDLFRRSCAKKPAFGIAALYSYESQIPEISSTKIDGLKRWYGLTDPSQYRYFSEHETADVTHAAEEKSLLLALLKDDDADALLLEVKGILDALSGFLTSFLHPTPAYFAA
jgi:pyrroloquinoline-quinone synthase